MRADTAILVPAGDALAEAFAGSLGHAGGAADLTEAEAVFLAQMREDYVPEELAGTTLADLAANLAACAQAGVVLVEQPLPEADDGALAGLQHPLPLCADESAHDRASLAALAGKYDAVNIKLDKAGGLTEALAMLREAERMGLTVMAGCMVATSLAMAPAMLIAQAARFVDLDGPLLLAKDRAQGLVYRDSMVAPPSPLLWG